MTPDPSKHNTDPDYMHVLVARIDRSQSWIAAHSGISRRRIQYLLAGVREMDGQMRPVALTYPEQFVLEVLADASENLRKDLR